MNLLEIKNLNVEFETYGGSVKAVRGISLNVKKGRTLAIVGESGCGKSVTFQSIMSLIASPPGKLTSGSALFDGQELIDLPQRELNKIRGKDIGFIFQDSMSSLNPTTTIGNQLIETVLIHSKISKKQAWEQAIGLLERVHISEPARRMTQYPFELSGGMRQRVMIAMAISCQPKLLIADEPTTALDVTIQAQILELLKELQQKNEMAMVLITHDLGVVAKMADDVAVMYAGQIVELGGVNSLFSETSHPYTLGLKNALPSMNHRDRLTAIKGHPPDLFSPPPGCAFHLRCPFAMKICATRVPPQFGNVDRMSRCWLHHSAAPKSQEFPLSAELKEVQA